MLNLTLDNILALFGIMLVGALIPGLSVLTVVARTAAHGFIHGVLTTLGIITGDIIFILIAIYGLAVLTDVMGGYFIIIRYLGGVWLIWLGITLARARAKTEPCHDNPTTAGHSSYIIGLIITLGDQKAILFYLGFFPALMDLSIISTIDTVVIIIIASVAISSKLVYALATDRAHKLIDNALALKRINLVAAFILVIAGVLVIFNAHV